MNVVLVHPVHGAKVAINEKEMELDVKNGWIEYNPSASAEKPADVESVEEAPTKRKYTRKLNNPIEQPNDMPNFLATVSDESEGN